jgi:UDP-N-acetylmuramyl pentapeptide phosphotransferase/UDP-N-acetylglucosamine-1-phosphate transferase
MMRLLYSFLLALATCCAYAQSSVAEPPVEHASPVVVVIFVVVFIAGCVGFVWYTWHSGRKNQEK